MVNNLDSVYSALADPTRRLMVERLGSGPLSVSELGEPLAMTLAAVGKHISVLESAGIIRTAKVGRVRSCTLVPRATDAAASWLDDQRSFWETRLDSLEGYLA